MMVSFNNIDNSAYHRYSDELQVLYQRRLRCTNQEEADEVQWSIHEKVIEAMLDWDLGRSDLRALGRLINLCENRECSPDPAPEIQYLPNSP